MAGRFRPARLRESRREDRDALRRIAIVVVTVFALGLFGALAGPEWDPEPLTTTLQPEVDDPAVGDPGAPAVVGAYETTSWMTTIDVDGVQIDAQVIEPVGAGGGLPAVLFLHGAGTGSPHAFTTHQSALASAGVVTMTAQKRQDTYSTSSRDYAQMALDYLVSLRVLAALPGVDPERVGVYAESEGAWIAPVMAASDDAVSFLALISAPVVPPREQAAFASDSYLRNLGVPPGLMRAIPRAVGIQAPGGGFEYINFDITPWLEQVDVPIFMAYGTDDASMPIVQGPQQVMAETGGGPESVTLRYFEGANHGLRVDGEVVPEFLEGLARWVLTFDDPHVHGPQIAGSAPVQRYVAAPLAKVHWFADGDMLIWVMAGSAAAAVGGAGLWAAGVTVRRVARSPSRPLPSRVARHTGAAALSAILLLVVLLGYIYQIAQLALGYQRDLMLVWGGWVLVQVIGVVAAALLTVSVRTWWSSGRRLGWRWLGPMNLAAVSIAHGGVLVLLVMSAYWGAYQPLW